MGFHNLLSAVRCLSTKRRGTKARAVLQVFCFCIAAMGFSPQSASAQIVHINPSELCTLDGAIYVDDSWNEAAAAEVAKAVVLLAPTVIPLEPGTRVNVAIVRCRLSNAPDTTYAKGFLVVRDVNGNVKLFATEDQPKVGNTIASGVSANPHAVGGYESDGSSQKPYHAYRFDLSTKTFLDLGTLNGAAATSFARGVNHDGSLVVGYSDINTPAGVRQQAFRWTEAGGMVPMGAILTNGASRAFGVDDTGVTIVGDTNVSPGVTHAFSWTQGGGFVDLGALTNGANSRAAGISVDGTTIFGASQKFDAGTTVNHAFRWQQGTGMVDLGVLPGHSASSATAASANGAIVVGVSDPFFVSETGIGLQYGDNARAFIWTQQGGIRDLNTALSQAGVDLTGVTLVSALGITQDGHYVSGQAFFPDRPGVLQGYNVYLPNAASNLPPLVAAVLPSARTTVPGNAVTAFATIINTGTTSATGCYPSLPAGFAATFNYQTTNASNELTGTANTPANIAPGKSANFVFGVTPTAVFSSDIPIRFGCANSTQAPLVPGLTTFLTTSAATQPPDMLSIAVTPSSDGILSIPGVSGTGFAAMAAINIGTAGTITFAPSDTALGQAPRNLPVELTICQTNAQGMCLTTPAASQTVSVAANQTLTFTILARGLGTQVPFDPARSRVFIQAKENQTVVGAASVAVRTQ